MSITYLPERFVRQVASEKTMKRLVSENLSLNRTVLNMIAKSDVLSKKTLERIALKVIKQYKEKYKEELAAGLSKAASIEEALNGRKLMVQRIQNAISHEISNDIKSQYRGEFYRWLPSNAKDPDPEHQLKYGETFQIGKGEMPGERWGCQCGMEILVNEKTLDL